MTNASQTIPNWVELEKEWFGGASGSGPTVNNVLNKHILGKWIESCVFR